MSPLDQYREYLDQRDAEIQRELKAAYVALSEEVKLALARLQALPSKDGTSA